VARARHLQREAEAAHGAPSCRLVDALPGALRDPAGDLRRCPQPAVGSRGAQHRVEFAGRLRIQAGLGAGLDRTPLGGDGFCAAGVVALSQLRDPARGAPDAARRIGGARALRDQVEGAPARLLLRLTALPVTPRVRRSLNAA